MKNNLWLIVIILLASTLFAASEQIKSAEDQKTSEVQTTPNISQYKVTLIELGSVKCMPCRMMVPVLDEVEKEYPNVEIVFYDVWTREGQPYGQKYNIRAIPTQIFLDADGKEYFRHTGFFPKEELVKVLQEGLKK